MTTDATTRECAAIFERLYAALDRISAGVDRIAANTEALALAQPGPPLEYSPDGSMIAPPQPRARADGESFPCRHGDRGAWGGTAKSGRVLAMHFDATPDGKPRFVGPPKGESWTPEQAVEAARRAAEECLAGTAPDGSDATPF